MDEKEARMALFQAMDGNLRMSRRHELLDAYAHALAEKIRSLRDSCEYAPDETAYKVMSGSADLIDPQAAS